LWECCDDTVVLMDRLCIDRQPQASKELDLNKKRLMREEKIVVLILKMCGVPTRSGCDGFIWKPPLARQAFYSMKTDCEVGLKQVCWWWLILRQEDVEDYVIVYKAYIVLADDFKSGHVIFTFDSALLSLVEMNNCPSGAAQSQQW
jgi:hypothetical protein